MLEKLKNKALRLNLKKCFLFLLIACVIFGIASGIVLSRTFDGGISLTAEERLQQREEWMQSFEPYGQADGKQSQTPQWGWYAQDGRYGDWNDQGWASKGWNRGILSSGWEMRGDISTGNRILFGAMFGIGLLLGAAYWLLCMAWAYQKAHKMGGNTRLWTIATLFFNLYAIAALYVYSLGRGTCKNCGRLKQRGDKYCSGCGARYQQECSHCHAPVYQDSNFCPNCGEAM